MTTGQAILIAMLLQVVIWHVVDRPEKYSVTVVHQYDIANMIVGGARQFNSTHQLPYHFLSAVSTIPALISDKNYLVLSQYIWLIYMLILTWAVTKSAVYFFGERVKYICLFLLVFNFSLYQGGVEGLYLPANLGAGSVCGLFHDAYI
ncbi:hypothetical protein ACFLQV_01580 [Calditrichota bacterium]